MTSDSRELTERSLLFILSAIFLLSGASALIYQVLWLRMLGLIFGVTVYAASTVWASFMTGLAIGSVVAGRIADRVRRPLVWFAGTELAIAIAAGGTQWAFSELQRLFPVIAPHLHGGFGPATFLRFAIVFVTLVVPTALMGATLPLIVTSSLRRRGDLATSIGVLYGSNTAGAIGGALLAGLWSIPQLGVHATFRMAIALNVAAAFCGLLLSRSLRGTEPRVSDLPATPRAGATMTRAARAIILATFTLSGAVALALEVIWLRSAIIIAGPTVYTVSILLATILGGIAIGSWIAPALMAFRRSPLIVLALLEAGVSLCILGSLPSLTHTNAIAGGLPAPIAHLLPAYLTPVVVAAVLVAFPSSLLMGAAFPIGLQSWAEGIGDGPTTGGGSRLGVFYSLNVCGGIAGSLLAGFVMLPALGSRTALVLLAAMTMTSAIALLAASGGARRNVIAGAAVMAAAFLAGAAIIGDPVGDLLAQRRPGEPVIWREEGVQTTASIHTFLGGTRRAMHLDGFHQAGDDGASRLVHFKIGTLPLALHPNPHDALVVGLGGGSTAGAMSRHSRLNLDVVELSDTVVRASSFFRHINFDLLEKPNVHLRLDDGRNFLFASKRRYDIITADTIQPVRAGSASLYSREYFTLVRDRLNDDGLALQWFAGTDDEYRLVARTFASVFPYVTAWDDGTLLVGTKRPLSVSPSTFNWKLQIPELRDALASIDIRSVDDLARMYRAGPNEVRRFVGDGPILTDDRPILEYFLTLPRDHELNLSGLRGDPREILGE